MNIDWKVELERLLDLDYQAGRRIAPTKKPSAKRASQLERKKVEIINLKQKLDHSKREITKLTNINNHQIAHIDGQTAHIDRLKKDIEILKGRIKKLNDFGRADILDLET